MNEDRPGAAEFFRYLKEKRSLWLIAAALVLGVCLMLLGGGDGSLPASAEAQDMAADTSELEARVATLCERVTGHAGATVMITMDTAGEVQYAKDIQVQTDDGRREERAEFVTVSQGLVPTVELMPRIRGVAIVCAGGDDPQVQLKLTGLLCALFGIASDAICIAGAG